MASERFTDLSGTERTQADPRVPTYSRLTLAACEGHHCPIELTHDLDNNGVNRTGGRTLANVRYGKEGGRAAFGPIHWKADVVDCRLVSNRVLYRGSGALTALIPVQRVEGQLTKNCPTNTGAGSNLTLRRVVHERCR